MRQTMQVLHTWVIFLRIKRKVHSCNTTPWKIFCDSIPCFIQFDNRQCMIVLNWNLKWNQSETDKSLVYVFTTNFPKNTSWVWRASLRCMTKYSEYGFKSNFGMWLFYQFILRWCWLVSLGGKNWEQDLNSKPFIYTPHYVKPLEQYCFFFFPSSSSFFIWLALVDWIRNIFVSLARNLRMTMIQKWLVNLRLPQITSILSFK